MDQRPDDFQPSRLTATMASQRLLVLDFVRGYFARWKASPSLGEIGNALQIDRKKVQRAIRSLAADGMLHRTPGPRGLSLPDSEAEAIRQLQALGWVVDADCALATKAGLLPRAALDYPHAPREGQVHDQSADARTKEP